MRRCFCYYFLNFKSNNLCFCLSFSVFLIIVLLFLFIQKSNLRFQSAASRLALRTHCWFCKEYSRGQEIGRVKWKEFAQTYSCFIFHGVSLPFVLWIQSVTQSPMKWGYRLACLFMSRKPYILYFKIKIYPFLDECALSVIHPGYRWRVNYT